MMHAMLLIRGGPAAMAREFRQLVKAGLFELIENWHKEIAPHHFDTAAERRYNYKPRSTKYLKQKAKVHPMAGPLEFSGMSKQQLTERITISGSSKRATGTMNAPPYFWMTAKNHPNMGEELTQTTAEEARAMARRLNDRVTEQLKKLTDIEIYR